MVRGVSEKGQQPTWTGVYTQLLHCVIPDFNSRDDESSKNSPRGIMSAPIGFGSGQAIRGKGMLDGPAMNFLGTRSAVALFAFSQMFLFGQNGSCIR